MCDAYKVNKGTYIHNLTMSRVAVVYLRFDMMVPSLKSLIFTGMKSDAKYSECGDVGIVWCHSRSSEMTQFDRVHRNSISPPC